MKMFHLYPLFLLLVFVYNIHDIQAADCNRLYGPAGTVHCIKISRYNNYQWATCRTDDYVQTKSNKRHLCTDRTATYCYYQCMVDVYNKNSGAVYSHCKCYPGGPQPTEGIKLPVWCYSPSGTNCNWYSSCLKKAYPDCEDDDDDHAIAYTEKFCKLYDDRHEKFSQQGKLWINAVRKCLQLKLVPLVDKTRVKKCADLKTTSFQTHSPCYTNPDGSSLSYCDLSFRDKNAVFWMIKSEFRQTFWPSLKGLLDVRRECENKEGNSKARRVQDKIQDEINREIENRTKTDSVNDETRETEARIKVWLRNLVNPIQLSMYTRDYDWVDQEIADSKFAGKVIDAVASQRGWQEKGITWFAYTRKEYGYYNRKSIRFLVADRFQTESGNKATNNTNVAGVLVQLSADILNGNLDLRVNGSCVDIMKLNGCLDMDCKVHAFNITSNSQSCSTPTTQPTSKPHTNTPGLSSSAFLRALHAIGYTIILSINFIFVS